MSIGSNPRVTFFQRKPRATGNFTLEFIADDIRTRLRTEIEATVRVAPFLSNGLVSRLLIIIDARLHRGALNHITGDIQFAALGTGRRATIPPFLTAARSSLRRAGDVRFSDCSGSGSPFESRRCRSRLCRPAFGWIPRPVGG